MTVAMTRRRFIVRVALGVGGCAVLHVVPTGCSRRDEVGIDLSLIYSNPDDILAMGRDYLIQFPAESVEVLERELDVAAFSDDPMQLRAAIAARIRADFDARKLFAHRGWIFARSEGRLAALAVLD